MAAPTLMEATCVAVLEVSTEQDRGERLTFHQNIFPDADRETNFLCAHAELADVLVSTQSLHNRLRLPRPVRRG